MALPLYEAALARMSAKFGADHPHTLDCAGGLAACYFSLRRLDRSVPLFEELLPRQEKKLGRGHPHTRMTVANLGVNYNEAGRSAEAVPLLEEAHRAATKYPALRWVGQSLLDAYGAAGRSAEVVELIGELLADARKPSPRDGPQRAGVLARCGLALLEVRRFADAEPLLRECLAIREQAQPGAWATFNATSMLGGALLGQKRYADAEPLLLGGYEGLKAREKARRPPAASPRPSTGRVKYPFVAPPPRPKG